MADTDFAWENLAAEEVVEQALHRFSPDIALACSFQAEESILIDMMHRSRGPAFRVFTLDTGRLDQETYDCMEAMRARYGIEIEVFFPDFAGIEAMVRQHGVNLFFRSVAHRRLCCSVRKVEPLKRALKGLRAWMTGLRREQAPARSALRKLEIDRDHGGILKINPLVDWTTERVWRYIRENGVPYNRLYDRGYASIGCAPCTRAVGFGEELRAGRWWWEPPEGKECGLHAGSEQAT
ncbi:MAG TPA: phosphoadenylyl-sulfate reductase [candidate division Zixibacteria bacterium]|nr:phosphoadenylyl-sulfate reductase [candidate division Zixibacteria bacterium]